MPNSARDAVSVRAETPLTSGLTASEVAHRVAAGRTNAFTQATSRSVWSIVRANVFTLFNGIVLGCFVVLLVLGRWPDALFGFSAMANAIIGSTQEFRAKRALDRLALVNTPLARVRRDGAESQIEVAGIVIDDLLVLRAGDQVPADAIVTGSDGLQLDESLLTGESEAVEKAVVDRVLCGSIVISGAGEALVDRVGAESFANSLAVEARRFSLVASELRTSINRVLRWVAWIVGPVALLVLNAQMVAVGGWSAAVSGASWKDAATASVAAIVAMVPLGLVLMTSIAFAVGAVRLAKQQVLVQELPAVEALARVDLICLDKTGTLTQGDIVFDGVLPVAPQPGWEGVLAWYGAQADANATARSLASRFADVPLRPATDHVAFSSLLKWSAVVFDDGMWILGAPEIIFPSTRPFDAAGRYLATKAAELSASGLRTLVLAHSTSTSTDHLPPDAVAVVLLTFRENIRPDAAATLAYFAAQGVGVRIISGDNPQTVAAVAREVGLEAPEGFDARNLPDSNDELLRVLEEHVVFGRVTPDQKRRIVVALQAAGHVVAMTGDGVNDALAIKEADIGIAMNSGAAATKAVARLILLDGRFSHLPDVVAEGRRVIANIERVSMLFLTKTAYATFLAVTTGILFLPFPFLPRQLSLSDALTIGIPAFFLALLPNARRYLPGFLHRSLGFAIPAGIGVASGLTGFTIAAAALGIPAPETRAGATLVLAVVGFWVLIALCRPLSRFTTVIVSAMAFGLVLVYTIPISRSFFALVTLGEQSVLLVAVTSALTIILVEIARLITRAWPPRRTTRAAGGAQSPSGTP